jgi:hypothetical protein
VLALMVYGPLYHHDRVAVRRRLCDQRRRNGPARAAAIVDYHRLADLLRHELLQDPRQDVGRAARRKSDHEPDGAFGVIGHGALRVRMLCGDACTGEQYCDDHTFLHDSFLARSRINGRRQLTKARESK